MERFLISISIICLLSALLVVDWRRSLVNKAATELDNLVDHQHGAPTEQEL
jgi:hypothetical protein